MLDHVWTCSNGHRQTLCWNGAIWCHPTKITFQLYTYIYIYAYTCVCQRRTWTNRANHYELRHVHNSLSQEKIMFYDCTRVSDRNLWCHFRALRCNTCHCYNCELWRSRPCVDISCCIIHSSHIWIVSVGTNRIEGDRKLPVLPFIHPSVYLSVPHPLHHSHMDCWVCRYKYSKLKLKNN